MTSLLEPNVLKNLKFYFF